MASKVYTDESLNLFIDGELDADESNACLNDIINNPELRERVCQLKAVRELVGFSYQSPPWPNQEYADAHATNGRAMWNSVAACLLVVMGLLIGWSTHEMAPEMLAGKTTASNVFSYFADQVPVADNERKFILHVSTSNIRAVNEALDEADTLLTTYRERHIPLKIDIIANKDGIDMLRVGVSPYLNRIEKMVKENDNVSLFACARSIKKARLREGHDIVILPEAITNKTARELIPERLNEGWVYIKV